MILEVSLGRGRSHVVLQDVRPHMLLIQTCFKGTRVCFDPLVLRQLHEALVAEKEVKGKWQIMSEEHKVSKMSC